MPAAPWIGGIPGGAGTTVGRGDPVNPSRCAATRRTVTEGPPSSMSGPVCHGVSVTIMTTDSAHRSVRLERIENSRYVVTNDRGGQITIGKGEGNGFTPVDLLLAGIGGCTAIDVDILTSRRAEPEQFELQVDAEKVRDQAGNHLADIVVTFRIRFPGGEPGEAARTLLPDAVRKSHERLCTVSRTVELGTPIATRIE